MIAIGADAVRAPPAGDCVLVTVTVTGVDVALPPSASEATAVTV
jgi:hypothetical protein